MEPFTAGGQETPVVTDWAVPWLGGPSFRVGTKR